MAKELDHSTCNTKTVKEDLETHCTALTVPALSFVGIQIQVANVFF